MRSKAMVRGTLDVVLVGGLALGLMALTGCGSSGGGSGTGGGGTTPAGTLAAGGAAEIYAIQYTGQSEAGASILSFGISTSTNPTPAQTLVTPSTIDVESMVTDSSGQVYVGGTSTINGGGEILVYPAGSTGTATPTRTVSVDPSVAIGIGSMAVDGSGNIYFTGTNEAESSCVAVIPASANGATTPTTLLTSALLTDPFGVAVDAAGKMYVTNETETGGQILVFAVGANGSDAPMETISSAAETATTASIFVGLAVDGSGNIFTVQDAFTYDSSGDATSATVSIEEFASGATTPTKSIAVATGLTLGGGLRLDGVGNVYLITDTQVNDADSFQLLGFGPNASGSVTPGYTVTPSALTDAGTAIGVH